MKKMLAILLAFTLIFALAACQRAETPVAPETAANTVAPAAAPAEPAAEPAEPAAELPEPTEPVTEPTEPGIVMVEMSEPAPAPEPETWYGQTRGMNLVLTLNPDGSYVLSLGEETSNGAWTEDDGIVLDGNDAAPLYRVNGGLMWSAMGLTLSGEAPAFDIYEPADVVAESATAELFNGYWKSAYIDADGTILSAYELNDKTDLYIEAPKAALGGPLFGDVGLEMTFAEGALIWTEGDVSIRLELQEDGLLRMTLTAPTTSMTLYLLPQYVEGISPAAEP